MCKNLLQYQIAPRLVKVAKTIMQEQSKCIRELKQVRKDLC